MKKTPKITLIGIVAALVVLAIIGVAISFGVKSFNNSMDDLEDKWGDIVTPDSDESESSSADNEQDSSNSGSDGSDESTAPAEKTKFTLADGDIIGGYALGSGDNAGLSMLCFYCIDLKPNTTYTLRWSLDSTIKDIPAYFKSETSDSGDLVYKILIDTDFNPSVTTKWTASSQSALLINSCEHTTDDSGTLVLYLNYVEADTEEEVAEYFDEYLKHVNYVEFVEVTE